MSADIVSADLVERDDVDAADAFAVDLDGFEGPLHLLLDLARRQKVNLLQISILDLATQYLGFIEDARKKRIDLAADYLLMASWLAYLKSRLMLPRPKKEAGETMDGDEMAARLAFRLKRLEAMRDAGDALLHGGLLGQDVFVRGAPERPKVIKTTEYDASLWQVMAAFGAIRQRKQEAAPHRVENQYVLPLESARQHLRGLSPRLTNWSSLEAIRAQMDTIDPDLPPRSVIASVFSAALELARDGDFELRQGEHFSPLYLRATPETTGGANP